MGSEHLHGGRWGWYLYSGQGLTEKVTFSRDLKYSREGMEGH